MKYLHFFLLFLLTLPLSGQSLITLLHQGQATYYPGDQLDTAYHYAATGDTILLPGGEFVPASGTLEIDKELYIIGVGHRPDSTAHTGNTRIVGNIRLRDNADNGSLEGIYLTGYIIGYPGENIENYAIKRSLIYGRNFISIDLGITGNSSFFINSLFRECIFRQSVRGSSRYSYTDFDNGNKFINNIFSDAIYDWGSGCQFEGNIFFSTAGNLGQVVFQNNIFLTYGNAVIYSRSSAINNRLIFLNNLFVKSQSVVIDSQYHFFVNNAFSQPESTVFIQVTGSFNYYNNDYHLQPTSPGYTLATDGGPVGIYGGQLPAKPSSRPAIPSIIHKQVGARTDSLGRLPIRIRVKAEDY